MDERLGELYESIGNVRDAAQHYRRFLDLWKDAEPPLQTRVAKVRRAVARQTNREPAG